MNKNDIVKAMLIGNEPRMLMGYITNVKTEMIDRLVMLDNCTSFDKINNDLSRADFKVNLEFVFYTEDDEGIKEVRKFLEDIDYERNRIHSKAPFILMRTE